MNREKHQADALHVVDDSMSFDEIPKKPVGLSLGMKPLGQSHFSSPPPPYHSISSSVLNWNPTNIYMADFNNRLCSFNKWPKQIKQTPEMLALSGFYYHGVGDYVDCFYCGLGVHEWEDYDNVNFEHHRHSPNCKYLDIVSNI